MARSGEPPATRDETGIGPVGVVHVPVMEGQVVEGLRPRPGARLVDVTIGTGGHAAALLAAAPDVRLLGLDRDAHALGVARHRLAAWGDRVHLSQARFGALARVLDEVGWTLVDGILADLGVSSLQLDDPSRGFSFRFDAPLDMRMGPDGPSAADIVNDWPVDELARLLATQGEEPRARAVARAIVAARPIDGTGHLATVVARVAARPRSGVHPATRTFQAIRMAVNDELAELGRLLADGWRWLAPGGRFGVLAYHSLEDRLVKQAFRAWATACRCPPGLPVCRCGWVAKVRLVTRGAVRPTAEEIDRNPRARSARWRVVERLGETA